MKNSSLSLDVIIIDNETKQSYEEAYIQYIKDVLDSLHLSKDEWYRKINDSGYECLIIPERFNCVDNILFYNDMESDPDEIYYLLQFLITAPKAIQFLLEELEKAKK